MGVIFNFTEHTILGFEAPGFEATRMDVTDVAITFSGEYKNREGTAVVGKIDGKIDRYNRQSKGEPRGANNCFDCSGNVRLEQVRSWMRMIAQRATATAAH